MRRRGQKARQDRHAGQGLDSAAKITKPRARRHHKAWGVNLR
jgi:hypothetical protein